MTRDLAETIALEALAWLVGHDELGPVFLGSTGASAGELADRASEEAFQLSVLEFLTLDDAWVTGFCDAAGRAYELPMQARAALAGPAGMHWT